MEVTSSTQGSKQNAISPTSSGGRISGGQGTLKKHVDVPVARAKFRTQRVAGAYHWRVYTVPLTGRKSCRKPPSTAQPRPASRRYAAPLARRLLRILPGNRPAAARVAPTGICPPGLATAPQQLKKPQDTAWVMPRARLDVDSLSPLRVSPSAASGRPKSPVAKSARTSVVRPERYPAWDEAVAIQPMPPLRLPFCITASGREAQRGDPAYCRGVRLALPAAGCDKPDGVRPGRRHRSPVPGLPTLRLLSGPQQLQGEARSCRWGE